MRRGAGRLLRRALAACCALTAPAAGFGAEYVSLRFGGHELQVEVARSPEARARGLMFRKSLPPEGGMLLLFPTEQRASIWMKDTPLSLDLLFLTSDGTVLLVAPRQQPFSTRIVTSATPVRAVLELPGGAAERLGLRAGDRLDGRVLEVSAP